MDNRTRFGFSYNHLFVQRKELIMGCVDDALLMDTVGIGCLQMLLDRLLFTLIRIEVFFLICRQLSLACILSITLNPYILFISH